MTNAPKIAIVTNKSILMTFTFKAAIAETAMGKPPIKDAIKRKMLAAVLLEKIHWKMNAITIKRPVRAVSLFLFCDNHLCMLSTSF